MKQHNWIFVKEIALRLLNINKTISQTDVELIFKIEQPERDVKNVYFELKRLSVNSQSRLSYLPLYGKVKIGGELRNKNKINSPSEYPRISDPNNENDTLYFLGDGKYEIYHPEKHGIFVITLDNDHVNTITCIATENTEFQNKVLASLKLTREQRLSRLQQANTTPVKIESTTTILIRNPDVVAERLFISQGYCYDCRQFAPFNRKSDGSPYLEVHHIVPLANDGADSLENTVALCPNCHRKRHYG